MLVLGQVTRRFPTSLSPYPPLIAAYVFLIYIGQIGYCFLLVLARKPETKVGITLVLSRSFSDYVLQATVVKGVGLALAFSNFVMAAWAIAWVTLWAVFHNPRSF